MNKKFNISVYEANLDDNFFPVATRQYAVSIMNYVGENKDANVQLIKDGCQELIRFYEENGDTDNFEPYKYDLTNEEKRIAELEEELAGFKKLKEENAELQKELKKYSSYKTDDERIRGLQDVCGQWAEENTQLKEQLKNAIVPKYKYHKIVYAVANTDILKGQIEVFDFYQKKYLVHFYGIDDINCLGDEWCYEVELFPTKAEAQKYLEGLK